ncbi:MAG: DNA-binding protein Fis / transcriptional regulator, Fis family [Proteobacteria bacterium]|nr:DNA-binding protein Fis / transcriptional regulator, Fis family [Pseudomonadota bacterium]
MTDLAPSLDRPLPVVDRRPPSREDERERLIGRIAAIVDRNPPVNAVEELKRLLAAYGSKPARAGGPSCSGRDQPRCVIGKNPAMLAAAETVRRVAPTDLPVLILGESGTGKGLFAEMVHRHSGRSGPLIKVNCAALPETLIESELFGHERGAFTGASVERKGRFELAAGGTLFLDEVGETSPAFQVKLLRVLQDGEFERVGGTRTIRADVRIIAATNRDLGKAIAERSFRADLFYRLSVVPLTLPPLRDRREDIPELARRILSEFDRKNGGRHELSAAAVAQLTTLNFPGNIRELENCVKRAAAVAEGPTLTAKDFGLRQQYRPAQQTAQLARSEPSVGDNTSKEVDAVSQNSCLAVGRDKLMEALATAGWSQAKAARLLKVSPRQVGYAIRRYGIALKKL